MNFKDALLAAEAHGTDRMPSEADRRLRRRLGLEAVRAARPVWVRPAIVGFGLAVAAAVVVVVVVVSRPGTPEPTHAPVATRTPGLVDVSTAAWKGTVTEGQLVVDTASPSSATVTWRDAMITVAPGTRLSTTSTPSLVLGQGTIDIRRPSTQPIFVDVPMGRVVIAASQATITADREEMTLLVVDGTGHFIDTDGNAHALTPGATLVWPPPSPVLAPDAALPGPPAPSPTRPTNRSNPVHPSDPRTGSAAPRGAPGQTHPEGVPCTYKSDCDPDQTCRKDDRGVSVCMGHGSEGAACWFDNDCASNLCLDKHCAP